jgi:hypothetical protein
MEKEVTPRMSYPKTTQDLLAVLTPARASPPPLGFGRRVGAAFRLLMRREIEAGVALAGEMDKRETAARVARIEADLARAVQQRDLDLAAWRKSRAAVARLGKEGKSISF